MKRWHVSWHLPRRTVRLRLSLLYGTLFVASGAVLLIITNLLVRHATGNFLFVQSTGSDGSTAGIISGDGPKGLPNAPTLIGGAPSQAAQQVQQLIAQAHHQHAVTPISYCSSR